MKKFRNAIAALISTVVLLSSAVTINSSAADNALTLKVSTEKNSYSAGETVDIKVDVKNNYEEAITDLELKSSLPDDFKIVENETINASLEPYENKEYIIKAKADTSSENVDSPRTGDHAPILPIILFTGASAAAAIIIVRSKKARKLLAIVLCASTLSAYGMNADLFNTYSAHKESVAVTASFTYNNKSITAMVNASYTEKYNIIEVNTTPLGKVDNAGCFNIDKVITSLEGALAKTDNVTQFSYKITDMNDTVISEGDIPIKENWIINDLGFVVGANIIELKAVTSLETYTKELTVFNLNIENMKNTNVDLSDNDNDKLIAYFESCFGTDPNDPDTDKDGISDYDEIYLYHTEPTKADSDGNGINDPDEDEDNDGLTLKEEIAHETSWQNKDTDGDGISDGDEVNKYHTDPLSDDSDNDGLKDGYEIELGTDPLSPDTDNNGVGDNDEVTEQTIYAELKNSPITEVKVKAAVPGSIKEHITIDNLESIDMLSTDVVGRIGAPVEFNSDVAFSKADITFTYDESLLGDTKPEDLAIMWYDEENMVYRIFDKESIVDTNAKTVTYTTTHFSKYLVVDRQIWYDTWREPINYRDGNPQVETKYDISFVVDVSGSMSGTSIQKAKTAINSFIDTMMPQDKASLVSFSSYAQLKQPTTDSKEELKNAVNSLVAYGNTNAEAGLSKGISEICDNASIDSQRMIVMICDGDVNCTQETIDKAKSNNITVFTLNVINGDNSLLQKIADETGGEYFYAATTEDIAAKMDGVRNATLAQVDMTDTDGDGLYDVFETQGMRIQNGRVYKTNPFLRDSDNDGIPDKDEFIIPQAMPAEPQKPTIPFGPSYLDFDFVIGQYRCAMFRSGSDPLNSDSDGDGVSDIKDKVPYTKFDDHFRTVDNYNDMDYNNLMSDGYQQTRDAGIARYKSKKASLSDKPRLLATKSKVAIMAAGGYTELSTLIVDGLSSLGSTPTGAAAFGHYWGNSGKDYRVGDLRIAAALVACQHNNFYYNMNSFFDLAESTVKEGYTYDFATVTNLDRPKDDKTTKNWKINYHQNAGASRQAAVDWWLTFGGAQNAITATLSCEKGTDGKMHYKATYKYYCIDYYDWSSSGGEEDLAELHDYGWAQNFVDYGVIQNTVEWVEGSRYPQHLLLYYDEQFTFDGINDTTLSDGLATGTLYYIVN